MLFVVRTGLSGVGEVESRMGTKETLKGDTNKEL